MNLALWLQATARIHGDRPAVAHGTAVRYDYRGFARAAALTAQWLRERRIGPGDRVGLFMDNTPDYLPLLWGIWWAGAVAVPLNARLHPREAAWILENCAASLCLCDAAHAAQTAAVGPAACTIVGDQAFLHASEHAGSPHGIAPRSEDDAAWLFYTSGTTGVPKGAMLTHRNLLFAVQAYFSDIDKLGPGDAILHAAPLSHGSGLYGLPHFAAGAVNVIPESGGFDAEEMFTLMERWPGASFFAAPTMVVRMLASPAARAPRHLKTITYGGAAMYVADALRAIDLFGGEHLYQLFGQGESPMTITGLPQTYHCRREKLESCGVARTGVEVRVVDENDRDLPPGEVGEILTRSDCVMAGYWENPNSTAQTLRGGWLHTGDLGSLDAGGFLTIRDRSKDMIISGGSNIYPREIEEVLLRHPAVSECSVVGRPHAEWGEEVVAFIVSPKPVSSGELDALCIENIARFKRPRQYRFVDGLPKNNYGKVLKTELRKLL